MPTDIKKRRPVINKIDEETERMLLDPEMAGMIDPKQAPLMLNPRLREYLDEKYYRDRPLKSADTPAPSATPVPGLVDKNKQPKDVRSAAPAPTPTPAPPIPSPVVSGDKAPSPVVQTDPAALSGPRPGESDVSYALSSLGDMPEGMQGYISQLENVDYSPEIEAIMKENTENQGKNAWLQAMGEAASMAGTIDGKQSGNKLLEDYLGSVGKSQQMEAGTKIENIRQRQKNKMDVYKYIADQQMRRQMLQDQAGMGIINNVVRGETAQNVAGIKGDVARDVATTRASGKGAGTPKVSEAQLASASFGKKAQDSDNIIRQLEAGGYDPSSYGRKARGLPLIGDFTMTPQDRQYLQAQKEFIAAILRKESGGAITKEEFSEYGAIYFPQAGDDAGTIKQKAVARQRASENLISMAGPDASGRVSNKPYNVPKTSGNTPADKKSASKYSNSDQEALKWLQANPTAPQASAVRAELKKKGLLP